MIALIAGIAAVALVVWCAYEAGWWNGYLDAMDDRDIVNDVFGHARTAGVYVIGRTYPEMPVQPPDGVRRGPGKGVRMTDEFLQEIAEIYREALRRGDPPTATICALKHVTRSTASNWVLRARERGLLGPAQERRAGEFPNE